MFRRFFSKARTIEQRQAYRPYLEGLETRLVPATFAYNNTSKTLTVTVAQGDSIDFDQSSTNPAGHITGTWTTGTNFNVASPTKLVKHIVVKIPAVVTSLVDIDFNSIAISGNVTVTSATSGGVDVFMLGSSVGTLKVTSSAASANDVVGVVGSSLKGALTTSLNGSAVSDQVFLDFVSVGTNVTVTGKTGVDDVSMDDSSIAGKVTLNLGAGANVASLDGTLGISKTLNYTGTDGVDDVFVGGDLLLGGAATFKLGNGNNILLVDPGVAVFGKNLSVTGGTGDDNIDILASIIGGNATIKLGTSVVAQTLDINGSVVQGNLSITGGALVDDVDLLALTVKGSTTVKLLAGADVIDIDDSSFIGTALFDGSSGADDFFIEDDGGVTSFGGKLTVFGGADDDELFLGVVGTGTLNVGAAAKFDGGAGTNTGIDDLATLNNNGLTPTFPNWTLT